MKLRLKSTLIGLALGALALIGIGSGGSIPIGRYQVSGGSSVVVILDTATGKAWAANLSTITGTQQGFWEAKGGEQ